MDDESKAKSEADLAATRTADNDSDQNRYFVEDGLPTTSFECSILSEFGWTTRTIQQQQQQKQSILHHHHQRRSTDVDLIINNESESSSSVGGGLLFPSSSSNMVVEQAASTSNYTSVSSSSSDQDQLVEKSIGSDDQTPTPCVQIPSKRRGQRRIRQQRFAFVTKSEVDHLEDGYRWRKYGQKPVKNSPYPRGYYRCTNTKCTVKKRVERSCEDPSTVITTYEGQHCHQTAGFPRGSGLSIREAAFAVQMSPQNSQLYYPEAQHLPQRSPQGIIIAPTLQPTSVPGEPRDNNSMVVHTEPPPPPAGSTPQFPSEEGLLGDIVSPRLRSNFLP